MRIALLPSAYAPMIGGVEELTRRLARQLVLAGDEVEVWTPRLRGQCELDQVDGIVVRRLAMPLPPAQLGSVARFPFDGLRSFAAVRAAARAFRPDILHVQCFSVNGVYATAVGALERVPVVVTLQGETIMDDHDIFDRSVALRMGLRIALRRSAAVTGCSQFVLDDAVRRFGLAADAGHVIFNGVDLSEVSTKAVEVPFERFVLCLGRAVWKKGFDLLLDSFVAVRDKVPDVGLVVAGDGPYRARLEQRSDRLGLSERVHFTKALNRRDVAAIMSAASVFVLPSRLEPFGIVVLEAWRAGCPVVASSVGGTREFLTNEVDGLIADPYDTVQLAGAITRLLLDPQLANTLAAHAAEAVRHLDWPIIAQRYREVYSQVRR